MADFFDEQRVNRDASSEDASVSFQPFARLEPSCRVSVVAPSGPFDRASFDRGVAVLSRRYEVCFSERIFSSERYLAGPDDARRAELQSALDLEGVRAVIAARGGYGAMRLLPRIKWPPKNKALVGFSDITALHLCAQRGGFRSVHGPVITQLGSQPPAVINRLFDLLDGSEVGPLTGRTVIHDGLAEGPLLGGNLSVLTQLIGTPYVPSFRGAVLLLEDVGERPYRIDRMWTHLVLSGLLDGVAGIVLGEFTACEEKDADYSCAEVLTELASSLGVPCVAGFPIGHGDLNHPVPLGARVRLDASTRTLAFLEGAAE
jgi:muramoyltetrapeptide carboxypeptidase